MQQQKSVYQNLGGWLKFFYLFNLLAPILLIGTIFYLINSKNDLQSVAATVEKVISDVTICILSIIVALLIKKHNKKCITIYNICKLIVIGFTIGRFLFLSYNVTTLISGIIIQILQLAAWTLYFQHSERVKVYFGFNNDFPLNKANAENSY